MMLKYYVYILASKNILNEKLKRSRKNIQGYMICVLILGVILELWVTDGLCSKKAFITMESIKTLNTMLNDFLNNFDANYFDNHAK